MQLMHLHFNFLCALKIILSALCISHTLTAGPQNLMDSVVLHFAPNMKGKPCFSVALSKVSVQPSADSCIIVVLYAAVHLCGLCLDEIYYLLFHGPNWSMSYQTSQRLSKQKLLLVQGLFWCGERMNFTLFNSKPTVRNKVNHSHPNNESVRHHTER